MKRVDPTSVAKADDHKRCALQMHSKVTSRRYAYPEDKIVDMLAAVYHASMAVAYRLEAQQKI